MSCSCKRPFSWWPRSRREHRCLGVYGLLAIYLAGSQACPALELCRFQVMKTQGPGSRPGNSYSWSVWGLGFLPRLAQTVEA